MERGRKEEEMGGKVEEKRRWKRKTYLHFSNQKVKL